jgi:excinuclease ABC subunit C
VRDLLAHFRSIDAIQLASPEQIATAPGVGPALARQVWEYFHPEEDDAGHHPTVAGGPEPDLELAG